jgi:hypothetical protein
MDALVEEQAQHVRALKAAKAPKAEIDAAVVELKKRKEALAASQPAPAAAGAEAAEAAPPAAAVEVDLSKHFSSALALSHCPPGMTPEERYRLVASVAEECIEASELA